MKALYSVPELSVVRFSSEDIICGSDVNLDIGGLFGETVSLSFDSSEIVSEADLEESMAMSYAANN